MSFSDLHYALERTFDDHVMTRTEKKAFRELLRSESVHPEHIRRLSAHAFDLVRRNEGGREHWKNLDWLEETMSLLHTALSERGTPISQAYFSPGIECLTQVLVHCDRARESLDVCMYTITDDRIKKALLRAHERGVRVRVVTDDEKLDARGSDIRDLQLAGIEIAIDNDYAFMHHKFAIMDDEVLLNGSFNWTRGATDMNWENLVVSHDQHLIAQFAGQFEIYWEALPRL